MNFNVLDRHLSVKKSTFLEASAGTGKTFAIENIVVRLLLEDPYLTIDRILVVTFTNAATTELKERIYSCLKTALKFIEKEDSTDIPDYLKAIKEMGQEAVLSAKRLLKKALACFDQTKIFTIHSFCQQSLKSFAFEGDCLPEMNLEDPNSKKKHIEALQDFLRTDISEKELSPLQIHILLKFFGYDFEKLFTELKRIIAFRKPFETGKKFEEIEEFLLNLRENLKKNHIFDIDLCIHDLKRIASCFSGMANQKKELKQEIITAISHLAVWLKGNENVHFLLLHCLDFLKGTDPEKKLKKAQFPIDLNYKNLPEVLLSLYQMVDNPTNPRKILAQLAERAREFLESLIQEEEQFLFDDLLLLMQKNIQKPKFVKGLQELYKAAIIDEFQDTDPIQWEIFSHLFLRKSGFNGYFYLIGDPKQSIYAFRSADIYTYLQAKEEFQNERIANLDTNYRSQPSLIKSLNALFTHPNLDSFFELPQKNSSIPCSEVLASSSKSPLNWNDGLGSLHFFVHQDKKQGKSWPTADIEEKYFFPMIAEAIQRHHQKDLIPLKECAVLVKDRHQASRIQTYLINKNIPAVTQRSQSILQSPIFNAFRDLLLAVQSPQNLSAILQVLSSPLIGFSENKLYAFKKDKNWQLHVISFLSSLKEQFHLGLINFISKVLEFHWDISEKASNYSKGFAVYSQLIQLIELISEQQNLSYFQRFSLESILSLIEELRHQELESEKFKIWQSTQVDSVSILTIHVSKGLEYEIVFPIGLINRNSSHQGFFVDSEIQKVSFEPSERVLKENDAEKMRLLYVALTRAKSRLYVPILFDTAMKDLPIGSAAPLEIFTKKLLQKETYDAVDFLNVIKLLPDVSWSYCSPSEKIFSSLSFDRPQLTQPKKIDLNFSKKFIHSFSSLKQESHCAEKKLSHLPSGLEFGILIHDLLEKIPYEYLNKISSQSSFNPFLDAFENPEKEYIAELLFNTFKSKLGSDLLDFSLSEVCADKTIREMEFLMSSENNLLKGFMDLVFEHDQKYYIVDWKTNFLGHDPLDYSKDALEIAMKSHDYFLQGEIYAAALKRFLSIFEKRPFQDCFGGVFFLFIRGMCHKSNEKTGIFHYFPNLCKSL